MCAALCSADLAHFVRSHFFFIFILLLLPRVPSGHIVFRTRRVPGTIVLTSPAAVRNIVKYHRPRRHCRGSRDILYTTVLT